MQTLRVGIIGGGAAGMMTAMIIKEFRPETEVLLFEKNPGLGAKVIISGGGRCNVTTGISDVEEVLKRYPRGTHFLKYAMYTFSPSHVYEWFEAHGVKLKIEKDLRVFPRSDEGKEVVGMFEKFFGKTGVEMHMRTGIKTIQKNTEGFTLSDGNKTYEVNTLVITTGGNAYRHTGSTGDGYAFARDLGHTITELGPSLTSFITKEKWGARLAGITHPDVRLQASKKDGTRAEFRGAMLWTHKGITGPAVFALSAQLAFEKIDAAHILPITIDFKPDISLQEVEKHIFETIAESPKKLFVSTLHHFVQKSLAGIVMEQLSLPMERRNNEVAHKFVRLAAECITHFPLHLAARGVGDEFVTAGGVDTVEVNPKTMQSRICPGLYFAGEILNVDGFTGGFNLQASWAEGYLAGAAIAAL